MSYLDRVLNKFGNWYKLIIGDGYKDGSGKIRSEKLREHLYKEEYDRTLHSKIIQWGEKSVRSSNMRIGEADGDWLIAQEKCG